MKTGTFRVSQFDMGKLARQPAGANGRYFALDGLRGLAALLVVIHHTLLTWPAIDHAVARGPKQVRWDVPWLLTFTPLHFVWAGSEAVYLFFILSGFVLTLPFLREKRQTWWSYYLKRPIRLYLPVWGAIFFALIAAALVPRVENSGASTWTNLHHAPVSAFKDAILLGGTDMLNSPLWSLTWEMAFSFLLPVYVLAAKKYRRLWPFGLIGMFLAIGLGSLTNQVVLIFMPMFGVGVVIAVGKDVIQALVKKITPVFWVGLVIIAFVLFSANWSLPEIPGSIVLESVAASIFIISFLFWPPTIRLGSAGPVQWIGKRSFSLYLVHEPTVVSIALLTGGRNPLLTLALAIPISLLLAEIFYRAIEHPTHLLANFVGGRIERRLRRRVLARPVMRG